MIKKNNRLLGLKVYALNKNSTTLVVVADGKDEDLGSPGGKPEQECLDKGTMFFLKQPGYVEVTQPLRDRNGDVIAVLKTKLTTFLGETEDNAVVRATTIEKAVESGLAILQDINE